MNKAQRKKLLEAKEIIEDTIYDEQVKLDNLPENLQHSKVAEAIEDGIQWLEEARDALNEVGV